jgi:hypothetical protein
MVTSRIWFTPEQKTELWERWKQGHSISAIHARWSGATRPAFSASWLCMEGLLHRRGAGQPRR